jgi:hypothetical protein
MAHVRYAVRWLLLLAVSCAAMTAVAAEPDSGSHSTHRGRGLANHRQDDPRSGQWGLRGRPAAGSARCPRQEPWRVVRGDFTVNANLPAKLRLSVFAQSRAEPTASAHIERVS